MKIGFRTKVLVVVFCLLALPVFFLVYTYPGEQPEWVQKYQAAQAAWPAQGFVEWDRNAKLVLAQSSNFGGKMPPPEKMEWSTNFFEHLLWWFPLQDRGETMTYVEGLRSLASGYESQKKWEEAERFYRKAIELETANPRNERRPDTSGLIKCLKSMGKTKEALDLQKKEMAADESYAAQHAYDPYVQENLLRIKAKDFEEQGKFADAETCLKKRVDAYTYELAAENLAKAKQENIKSVPYTNANLNILGRLDDLADFYERQKNYAGQAQTNAKILSIRQSILPDDSKYLADNYDDVARSYEMAKKYDQAETALLQSIHLVEKEDRWEKLAQIYELDHKYDKAIEAMLHSIRLVEADKEHNNDNDVAGSYIRYAKLLETAGKKSEAAQARAKAHLLNPRDSDSKRYLR